MKRAIYEPTNTNTVVVKVIDEDFVEILIDGEFKVVSRDEVRIVGEQTNMISFDQFNQCMLTSLVKKPSSDLFYSLNTNKLTPEPHQYKPLIKFLNSQNNRLLIADEVGLGKTIEAGMIYKEIDKRDDLSISLIVVPSSLTLKWRNEFLLRFDENFEILRTNAFKAFLKEYEIYSDSKAYRKKIIISYHALRDEDVIELLQKSSITIDFLIMDEAHTFRNESTSTFEAAFSITNLAEYVLFLTATPVQNSYVDLFNILSLLDDETFLDFDYFKDLIKPNEIIHKVVAMLKNGSNLAIIQDYISEKDFDYHQLTWPQKGIFENFMELSEITQEDRVDYIAQFTNSDNLSYIISRTKKKDAGKFIPREAHSSNIKSTENEQIFYNAVVDFVVYLFSLKNPKIPSGFITVMPERMASSCMLASLESFKNMKKTKKFFVSEIDDLDNDYDDFELNTQIVESLDNLISKGELIGEYDSKYDKFIKVLNELRGQNIHKAIVFSFFKKTLSYLEKKLTESGVKVGKIDGDLTPDERFEKIEQFKNNKFDILLSSEVGSEGLDMQFCNVVFNYDLPWNPMRVEQRIGRIDRIGQTAEKLLIFNLVVEGTIEDRIYNRLYDRLGIFESSIGELEPILGDIQKDFQIQDIIKMSDKDIEQKLEIEGQSLIRRAKEIKEHGNELDGMLNDDYNKDQDDFDNESKKKFISKSCEQLFLSYLNKHVVIYKNQSSFYSLKKDDSKRLYDLLSPLRYRGDNASTVIQQKSILRKLAKSAKFKFTFDLNFKIDNDVELISIAHPLIKILADNAQCDFGDFSSVNSSLDGSFAIVYKTEFNSFKATVRHKVLLLNNNLQKIQDIDYYAFYESSKNMNDLSSHSDLESVKNKAQKIISEDFNNSLLHEKMIASETLKKKKNALKLHFKKKHDMAIKANKKATQVDIIRMRQSQLDNINDLERERISQLENKMTVNGSFQILSVIEMI
jgi:SNF2 family DNA or RNA helicase